MTPRRLDPDSIHEKLERITETLGHLRDVGPVDADRLAADPLVRAAVERWLTLVVDLAVAVNLHLTAALLARVERDYRSSFLLLAEAGVIPAELAERLAPSAGTRNVLVHDYVRVDLDLVAAATARALVDYEEYVTVVARFLRDRDG